MQEVVHQLPANGWRPRPYQMDAWDALNSGKKRALLCWPRRNGKDELALHYTATQAFTRVGTYWHMLPEASNARKAIWDQVNPRTGKRRIDEVFPLWCRAKTKEQEMMIKFINGSTWQVLGSDNYDSFIGSSPVGVVFSEWALADPASWAFVRPMLTENGGYALFITTPRGPNHAKRMFDGYADDEDWFVQRLTSDDTNVLTAEQLAKEKADYIRDYGPEEGEALFLQEYYCDWAAANPGAVYAHWIGQAESEGRVTEVPIDYRFPVRTAWDLGMHDATALWFYQDVGFESRFVHCYSSHGNDLQHYVDYAVNWCREKRCLIGPGILPHDVEVRELGNGRSRKEVLQALGLQVIVAPKLRLTEQIQATRDMLKTAWFDADGCEKGLEALRHYHYDYNEKNKTRSATPKHDWSSHFCSALAQKAVTGYDSEAGGWVGVRRAKPIQQPTRWI